MAAGSAFTIKPNNVLELVPEYNNVTSQTESMIKEYFQVSATAVKKYNLEFKAKTTTERNSILNHYNDQSGGYYPFSWQTVPSYIGSGSSITGRWVEGSYSETQTSNKFQITIAFEKAN